MREIKFRAWDGKKMDNTPMCCTEGPPTTGLNRNITNLFLHWHQPQYKALMQYTGLKDRHGKDIFEGDFVGGDFRRNIKDEDDLHKAEIKYFNACFYLCWSEDSRNMPMHDLEITTQTDHWMPDLEVIGNIYENPGLLTDKDQK